MSMTKQEFNAAVALGCIAGSALVAGILAVGWIGKHYPIHFWTFVCGGCVCALIAMAAHAYDDLERWLADRRRTPRIGTIIKLNSNIVTTQGRKHD